MDIKKMVEKIVEKKVIIQQAIKPTKQIKLGDVKTVPNTIPQKINVQNKPIVQQIKIHIQQKPNPQNNQVKQVQQAKPQVQNNQQKPNTQNNNKPQVQNKPVQTNGKKWVYTFAEGDVTMKQLLGGKGANLCDMTRIGLPVPPGFTITTEACDYFSKNNKTHPKELQSQVDNAIVWLENKAGMKFGDSKNPLLVSVRSGAAVSMPGMMDTILNLGLNDITLAAMIAQTKNERFCLDSYRRFIQMFGDVVMEVEHRNFEEILERKKHTKGLQFDTQLSATDLREIVNEYRAMIKKEKGIDFPQDVRKQLMMAVNAVFSSWNNARAITYRRLNDIKGLLGTAVNVQAMVFGNMGEDCGTGVAFTRNPSTGENKFYGEYLINAQGEDVVAGIRTPQPVSKLGEEMPEVYKQLLAIRDKLEKHYKDMQDIEFTVQKGKLYMLQTRNGKRTGPAAVRIAVDLVNEKLLTKEQGLLKVDASALDQLLHKRLDPMAKKKIAPIAQGLPASPGAAVGKIVFNAEDAMVQKERGEKVILVRLETSPEDIEGMHVSVGILTARGGMTSHAAVVARGMGKCCVAGCSDLIIDEKKKTLTVKDKVYKEGDFLTLDGSTGEVYAGQLPVIDPVLAGEFATLMKWARETKKLGIRTNADTPKDAKIARDFGAEGIGLTRTEHMFFEGERITPMREMILSDTEEGRRKALNKLLPFQRQDFEGIFEVMNNLPVIIRLLDPPLHEFLPKLDQEKEIKELSTILKMPIEKIKQRISELHEFNPMLGFRGCRLGVVYPEISEMQARAIFQAAINVTKKGIKVIPEIEVPNIISPKEFRLIIDIIKKVAIETGMDKAAVKYKIGTMIEFPRAAMVADELARDAEFMSFGTNDLTQTTLGFSRDDAGRFIPVYVEKNVFEKDPFQTIDQEGVGKVMKLAISKARSVKPQMDIGICGEHGGDPASVKFCHKIGLSNVSCSPYRVPIATLAAAQAAIEARIESEKNKKVQQVKPVQQQKQNPQNNKQPQKQVQQAKPKVQNNQQKQTPQKQVQNNNKQPQKQNQQAKPQVKQAVSIQDEIRRLVKEEISKVKK